MDKDLIFGLDIGTRNVVGIVGYYEGDQFVIHKTIEKAHQSRAMIDGQIHNIQKASETIKEVKEQLEFEIEKPLKEVAIAAAGRVLKTVEVETEIKFENEKRVQLEDIDALKVKALNEAERNIQDNIEDGYKYFCVGYSVIKFYLDGFEIESLEAHKTKKIGVKIIGTFLPQSVVESLYTAVENSGLVVDSLSLEPIAAINVAIPENFRLLNLCLVDIGAGTSDIAITKSGSITAYGMIPFAGDKLTEKIVHSYLVDFNEAEKIKLQLGQKKCIHFKDIIGIEQGIESVKILEQLNPMVDIMADKISQEIISLNGGHEPNAIFVVGGGGQIPGFTDKLAEKLGLPKERVVLKSTTDIQNIRFEDEVLTNPYFVTPIGICVTREQTKGHSFVSVSFNGKEVKLLKTKEMTIMDVVAKQGISYEALIAKNGRTLRFTLNNENIEYAPTLGKAAKILLNGKEATLKTEIHEDDKIVFEPSIHGQTKEINLVDLLGTYEEKTVTLSGKMVVMEPKVKINDCEIKDNVKIQPNDKVTIENNFTVEDLLKFERIEQGNADIYINGKIVKIDQRIKNQDYITLEFPRSQEQGVEEKRSVVEESSAEIQSSDEIQSSKALESASVSQNKIVVLVNNEPVVLEGNQPYIFVDIFKYIDFDLSKPNGIIQLELNGHTAAYTDSLKDGDMLKIYWKA